MNAEETRKKIKREFLLFSISILLIMCSYSGLADLQSSINIVDGLGTSALTITYSVTIVFSLFVTPIVVRQWGAKTLILVGEACFLVYVIANFYPRFWSLLPAGLVLGFGEATLFTPALMYCTHYGRIFANIGKKSVNVYVKQFIGYFYCIVQINEVVSNLISYIVLRVGRLIHENTSQQRNVTLHNLTIQNFSPSNLYNASDNVEFNMFLNCGANDCYDESTIENMKQQYVPMSSAALYIMISILTSLGLSAIVIFAYFIPDLPRIGLTDEEAEIDNNSNMDETKTDKEMQSISPLIKSLSRVNQVDSKTSSVKGIIRVTISSTFKHMADTQQVLLTPLTCYHGMYITFVSSEINRAFVSCIVGVEQIGIAMVFGGVSNVLVALMFGALSNKIGTRFLIMFAVLLDLTSYVFCLLWQPTENNTWLAYALCCILVSTDGIWQPLLDAKYADYFSANEEIAFAISNLWTCAGFTIMYGWSTFLCMTTKIYALIAVMMVGLVCFVIAENRRKVKNVQSSPSIIPVHVGPSSRL